MTTRMPARVYVGPVPIADASRDEAVSEIVRQYRAGLGSRVATANTDFVALARRDAQLADDLEACSIVVADGAPVAWLARAAGARRVERLTGVDLAPLLIEALQADGPVRVAIYGSTPDIANRAAVALAATAPAASIAPIVCPPFRPLDPGEVELDVAAIAAANPHIVLVALGCPRQERFIAEYSSAAPQAIWAGIGGSLDFYAGQRRRAPGWMQRAGLEWSARLAQEPGRLWQRYFLRDLPTLIQTAPGCVTAGVRLRIGTQQQPLN